MLGNIGREDCSHLHFVSINEAGDVCGDLHSPRLPESPGIRACCTQEYSYKQQLRAQMS